MQIGFNVLITGEHSSSLRAGDHSVEFSWKEQSKEGKPASISDPKGTASRRDRNGSNNVSTTEETSVGSSSSGQVELPSLRTGGTFRGA